MRSAIVPLLAAVVAGCGRPSREAPQPAPAASPAPVRQEMTVNHAHSIPVCVVRNGELTQVAMRIDSATGDTTTLDGQPFTLGTTTAEYAGDTEWYRRNEPILFRGIRHIKYGLPLPLSAAELVGVGEYRGVPLFAAAEDPSIRSFIYIPERPGCIFQRYEPPHRQQ
jgi:hypothetical protein